MCVIINRPRPLALSVCISVWCYVYINVCICLICAYLLTRWIESEEKRIFDAAYLRLASHPNIVLLCRRHAASAPGDVLGRHLPLFSLLIRSGSRFLHFNLVCALLNDLFGVQTRGGCMCAG